ncbi:hypothetical protein PsAD2_00034 [Pseudovibrio axinellae]|uniref:Inner membrane protein YhaI n=1 Tax=Pseudovibrio axinellae TaxID=989403 RepID=A0A166B8B6_9HYPH|nr:DUF805 domain-containing protein [Pseudovibrio axinellae]KZL22009.1 hypothetical protein PsAD2_00034 [Pseudovibrio axinellae]SEQ58898.1 Uncharacterized membrane protein YhaH, DUF805 family [Pseudovibrio axinellae]
MPEQKSPRTSLLWLFFNPFGRISREPYWLAFGLIWCVLFIALNTTIGSLSPSYTSSGSTEVALAQIYQDMLMTNPLLYPLMLFTNFMVLMLVAKRLQDRGITGFVALTLFLPFLNLLVPFIVGFLKSESGPNKYGPYSNSRPMRRKK